VPRGRPRNGVRNTVREKLIVEAVKLLTGKEYQNPDQVINGAIEALRRSAVHCGGLAPAYLQDVATRETSANRLIREVVLRAASPKNRREELSAHRIQRAIEAYGDLRGGQGRSSFRGHEKTGLPLDRKSGQTLSEFQKTPFFGLPTGEGSQNLRPPADNMGVENSKWCKNSQNHDDLLSGWPECREADLAISNHACDNSTYRKQ
jgi:hypothetical protein